MGHHKVFADGEKIPLANINYWRDYRQLSSYAEIVAAVAGFGASDRFKRYLCEADGYEYYWNGTELLRIPAAGGGGGSASKGAYTFIIYKSGSDYYAEDNEGNLTYGGSSDTGGIDGALFASVVNAAFGGLPSEGGIVNLNAGAYTLDAKLSMDDFAVVLQGEGIGTEITLADGVDDNMIEMTGASKNFQMVRDLYLHGNKDNNASGHGIFMNHNYGGGSDCHAKVEHCWIRETAQDGIRIAPLSDPAPHDTREAELINVTVTRAGENAFYIGGSDHKIHGCVAEQPAEVGFYLSTAQHQLALCKSFGAGWGNQNFPGFGLYTSRSQLTNCQAQDNYGHGFEIYGGANNLLVGCQADSNGINGTRAGFKLDHADAQNNELRGCVSFNRSGKTTQEYGLWITATPTHNTCDVNCVGNVTKQLYIQNVDNEVYGWEDGWNYQSAATGNPTGDVYNGRTVCKHDTTDGKKYIYAYINGAWVKEELT